METISDARGRKRFVELARHFRAGSGVYVPSLTGDIVKLLDPARNPTLRLASQRLWIACHEDGRVAGRICATYDRRHEENLGERAGWFGFFDADGPDSAAALLEQAWSWLREQGASTMLGPADPDTNHECGCLVEGHDDLPFLLMPHHPASYGDWIEASGLSKAKDLLAWETSVPRMEQTLKRMEPIVRRAVQRGGFVIDSVSKKDLPRFLDIARTVYNGAWRENWGFLPMTEEEFAFEAEGLKLLIDPEIVKVATRNGEPAGFILGLPDANVALHAVNGRLLPFGWLRLPFLLKKIRRFRTMALGVLPEYRNRGLDSALVYEMSLGAVKRGYIDTEMSWVLEDNEAMTRLARTMNGYVARRYRIYRRSGD